MHRTARTVLQVVAAVAVAACGSVVGPDEGSAGVFVLQTVEGAPVPYALSADPSIVISGRALTLSPDGTFTDLVQLTVADVVFPSTRGGDFRSDGASIRLTYENGQVLQAERIGGTLTLDDTGLVFVLTR